MSSVRLPYYGFRRVRSYELSKSTKFSCSDPRSRGVVQRLGGHGGVDPVPEDQHLDRRARDDSLGREVGEGDGGRDRVADRPARDAPDGRAVDADRLVAEDAPQRVSQGEAGQARGRVRVEGVAADVRLVRTDAEAEAGLV